MGTHVLTDLGRVDEKDRTIGADHRIAKENRVKGTVGVGNEVDERQKAAECECPSRLLRVVARQRLEAGKPGARSTVSGSQQ